MDGRCCKREFIYRHLYFILLKILLKSFNAVLQRDVKLTLVVGDKIANDFFIREGEDFSPVGAVPYIYEQNLREFVESHQEYIDNKLLDIRLWKNGLNTYHVKGLYVDQNLALMTGNNLNPRAWALDLENGLIIHDPNHLLQEKFMHEQQHLLKHTTKILSVDDIDCFDNYPEDVKAFT